MISIKDEAGDVEDAAAGVERWGWL